MVSARFESPKYKHCHHAAIFNGQNRHGLKIPVYGCKSMRINR